MIQKFEPEAGGLAMPLSQADVAFAPTYISTVATSSRPKPKRSRWRWPEIIFCLSLVACIMEGAFRKWVFSSGTIAKYLCYFSKDILFGLLVVTTWPRASINGSDLLKKYLTCGILLFVLGAIISSAEAINWVGAVLSTRALLCLPVVALLALPRLGGIKLEGLALVIGVFTVGNAALGFVQYHAPPEALINRYASDTLGPADMFQGVVRAAGTFSYLTGYGNMATVGAWAGLALLCLAAGRIKYVIAGWAIYLAALICGLVSISRATVLAVGMSLVVFVLSGRHGLANLMKAGVALILVFLLAYACNLTSKFTALTDKLMERNDMAGDTFGERTLDPITEIGYAFSTAPMGGGFGTQQVGGVYAETGLMKFRNFENQFPRLILETGILGLAGFFITWMGLLVGMFNARNDLLTEGLRRVCVLSIFLVSYLFFTNVAFNHTASFFAYWIFAVTIAATSARSEAVVASHG